MLKVKRSKSLRPSTKMPIMVRPKGIAKRVAYEILGVPSNMRKKGAKRKVRKESRLSIQEGPLGNS